jgi:hypothetical protein
MTKIPGIVASLIFFLSCHESTKKIDNETVKEGNKYTIFSSDTAKLAKLMVLNRYPPTHAKFKYTYYNNSGENQRVGIPGPSDGFLQAVLYFDTTTFRQLKTAYTNATYPAPEYEKIDFDFEWLDDRTLDELKRSDKNYFGHPDFFFGLGERGKLWLLENKVLVIWVSG